MDKILRFLSLGIMVYAVNIGWTYILKEFFYISVDIAYAIAMTTITILNFFLSLDITFRKKYSHKTLAKYIVFLIIFATLNYMGTIWMKNIFGEQYLYMIIFIVTGVLFFIKFYAYDRIVFTERKK